MCRVADPSLAEKKLFMRERVMEDVIKEKRGKRVRLG